MKPETKARIRRLLSEGAVIVFAILLAFVIDAWWARHLVSNEEAATLQALEDEFTANLEQVERVCQVYQHSRARMIELQDLTDEQIRALPQKEISAHMLALCMPWTFDPVLGTTNALISAGKLGILSNKELRATLTAFVNLTEDANNEVVYLQSFANDIWRAQIPYGGPWTDPDTEEGVEGAITGLDFIPKPTATDLIRVRGDRTITGLSGNFHLTGGYYELDLKRVRAKVQRILKLIRSAS